MEQDNAEDDNREHNWTDAVLRLSSTKADAIPHWQRCAWMDGAQQQLRSLPEARRALAEWKDYSCTSKLGFGRLAALFVTALVSSSSQQDDEEYISDLWEGLTFHIAHAPIHIHKKLMLWAKRLRQCDYLTLDSLRKLSDPTITNDEHVIASLVLGAWIDDKGRNSETSTLSSQENPWLSKLLTFSLQRFRRVDLAHDWLGSTITPTTWSEIILPSLLVKLKSHPDKALDIIHSWLAACGPGVLPLPTEEWRTVVLKHVNSNTTENRSMAHSIVQSWALSSSTGTEAVLAWAQDLCQAKVTSAPARLDLFRKMIELTHLPTCKRKANVPREPDMVVRSTISESFVQGLIALASKETTHKAESWEAVIAWFVFFRSTEMRLKYNGASENTKPIAQALASACLQQPNQAAHILPTLTNACSTTELRLVIACEMWKSLDWSKGMQALVENTKSKKIEPALFALYWSLLYFSSNQGQFPTWISKIIKSPNSFLYTGAIHGNPGIVAHCLVLLHSKEGSSFFAKEEACRALSLCITSSHMPCKEQDVVFTSLSDVVLRLAGTSSCKVANAVAVGIWDQVVAITVEREEWQRQQNFTRQARENENRPAIIAYKTPSWDLVRKAARLLLAHTVSDEKLWILSHVGSSLRADGVQRKGLVQFAKEHLITIERDGFVVRLLDLGGASDTCHCATLSLWTTIGQVSGEVLEGMDGEEGGNSSPTKAAETAQDLIQALESLVSTRLDDVLLEINSLTEQDIALFRSQEGVPFRVEKVEGGAAEKKKRMTEEEEWEEMMKNELSAKKKNSNESSELSESVVLSPQDKALVEEQRTERQRYAALFEKFQRIIHTIVQIVLSDIEVGNKALPVFAKPVMTASVMKCPAFESLPFYRSKAFEALAVMATCVYELEEKFATDIAHALLVSVRSVMSASPAIEVAKLPSSCSYVATVIQELDELGDSLQGGSFALVFPILKAVLFGPRTPQGCGAALAIMGRHTASWDNPIVVGFRREIATSVLELLRHDRAQAFLQPSPFEVLVACYKTDENTDDGHKITATQLAPLLDERGALGPKHCRVASMMALGEVASAHGKLIKQNPLAENRVWVNCFASDEDIRLAARRTWSIMHGGETSSSELSPPSALYAAPLLPLLSSGDASIVEASAKAFAYAMAQHPTSLTRNLENLCRQYIDAYPKTGKSKPSSADSAVSIASAPKTKPISASLPKKKAAPSTPAGLANIGKPKIGVKKKPSSAIAKAFLKPKEERKLDKDTESLFLVDTSSPEEEKDTPSRVATRLGVLRTLTATTDQSVHINMEQQAFRQLTSLLVAFGIAEVDETVKTAARNTFRDIVATHGGSDEAVAFLLPQLEAVLKSGVADESSLGSLPSVKVPRDIPAQDRRKEGVVVTLGSVAQHLRGPENEIKVESTVDMLLSALKTPSEDVQASVADALSNLMKKGRTHERIESIVSGLLRDCLRSSSLATRRGAAYGLSAAVKGSGIGTLKKLEVVKRLEEAFASGTSNNKEGALFAIELLSSRLGLLFEPYVIVLLPSLLTSFSDGSDFVRKAASHTAGLIMSKLSAHGVKLVTPAVLGAFDDPAWRTKQASIHMLGAMSHLAPKQLAAALPKVVPKLSEAFGDTHPKVRASAQEALDEISTVIRNPEIKSISPSLLKALTDPADYTQPALEKLIGTEFLHSIDAPSLALIVPILHRGLRDRGATVKRMGGLIAGNICTMINDPRDFIPYVPTLLPDLQVSLLDPIPDVRSTAAKALGSLARNLGDQILPELRPWLLKKLREVSCTTAERSGAAQGLTEVLIASGSETVEGAMRDEILPLRNHPEPTTREGVLWMLSFLPPALGQGFTCLIDASLPALVGGLSDENELVRDVAMRAGRVLIRSHGKVHVDKILPSLEVGLGDDDHRIRVASLSLLGDLLSMIGGTTVVRGDGDTQDDIRKAEKAQAQIALVLGVNTRKRVLSELYLARSDAVYDVRQNALQVWKTVVSVTARTLRDILSVLVSRIIDNLASGHQERTVAAAQCLGDIVARLSDSVLPQIIPVLRDTLKSGDNKTKLGVCVGLNEVIKCSTRDQITKYIEIIVKLVQDALSNEDADVRRMAASSFQSLHAIVGGRAFDEVVPSLMVALELGENEITRARALNGLTGILGVRSRELLPYIIPRLLQKPISTYHAQALAGVAAVTGGSIYHHFSDIIPAILGDLSDSGDADDEGRLQKVRDAMRSICLHVDVPGINILISEIASKCASDKAAMRRESCLAFEMLITERAEKQDFYHIIPVILRELLYRLNDDDQSVLKATNAALTALSNHVSAEELVEHIEFMRNLLASMVSDARRRKGGVGDGEFFLPGFNIAKGLDPLLPIYQRGILYGTPSIREVSAAGLGEALHVTGSMFLAGPLVVKMTGPLLRIVGDRNPSNVKVAILKTLGLILIKGGPALRAFVPQFQTTFVKNLSDPSRQVRVEAISALTLLMPLSARVDPLIKELISGSLGKIVAVEGAGMFAVQTATLEALTAVLEKGGAKAKLPATIPSALDASQQLISHSDQGVREGAAKVMGSLSTLVGAEAAREILEDILQSPLETVEAIHGRLCAVRRILASPVGAELSEVASKALGFSLKYVRNEEKGSSRQAGLIALGASIGRSADPKRSLKECQSNILDVIENNQEPMEVHRAVASGLAVALKMIEGPMRLDFLGLKVLDACLKIALNGSQRVQFAFNDVLWLALDVANGDAGLNQYCGLAVFDNQRSMKSLHSKVLNRIKEVLPT